MFKRNVLLTSPSATIPFDKENIPDGVSNAFEEAMKRFGILTGT